MFSTLAAAVSVLCLIETFIVMSSAYFAKRLFIGETAAISFTIRENRMGPYMVPRGTPLCMSKNAVH